MNTPFNRLAGFVVILHASTGGFLGMEGAVIMMALYRRTRSFSADVLPLVRRGIPHKKPTQVLVKDGSHIADYYEVVSNASSMVE